MFNTEKLSIEQFNEIKEKMIKLVGNLSAEEDSYENNPDLNMELVYKEFVGKYILYQQELLSYDLSNIPFEAWDSIWIITPEVCEKIGITIDDSVVDFSRTRANLDFDIVDIDGKGNFKNCNVRNIERCYISEDSFDEQTIRNNPNIFLSNSFSKDFKQKFYGRKLKMEDIIGLSDVQLKEIKENVKYEWCTIDLDSRFLGLERCIELYKYSPEDYYEVIENLRYKLYLNSDDSQYYSQLFTCELKDLKDISFNYFRETLLKSSSSISRPHYKDEYPQRLIDANDDIFLSHIDFDYELRKRYYDKKLTLDDVYNNMDLFKNVDVSYFINNHFFCDLSRNIGSDEFKYLIQFHKKELECMNERWLISSFTNYWNDSVDLESAFNNAFKMALIEDYNVFDSIDKFGKVPEWIEDFDFQIVESYNNIQEISSFSNKTFLLNKNQARVLYRFGFDCVLKFENDTHYLSDEFSKKIDRFASYISNEIGKGNNNKSIYEFMLENGDYKDLNSFNLSVLEQELSESQVQYLTFLKENLYSKDFTGLTNDEIEVAFDKNGVNLLKLYECLFIKGRFEKLLEQTNNLQEYGFDDKKIKVLEVYRKIESSIRPIFKEYILDNYDGIDIDKIDLVEDVLIKLSASNASEMFTFRVVLAKQLLATDDPIGNLQHIEEIFIKNNIPTVGKIYSVFQTLHPNCEGFNFSESSRVSPVLQSKSSKGREVIIFADLLKASFGSNNRSVKSYLENIEQGNILFQRILSKQISFEELEINDKKTLSIFVNHLKTLYNNTAIGKKEDSSIMLSDNIENDIERLAELFSENGTINYDLPDRIIKMFGHFAGFDTFNEAKQYFIQKPKQADFRNRQSVNEKITLKTGDFVKGIGNIQYLTNILQNGSVAKEFLGDSAGSDLTPLDTDLSRINCQESSLDDTINKTEACSYGPIFFVLKGDDRFIVTRRSALEDNQNVDTNFDLSKLEVFYTGAIGNGHYGLRTGFASSEINYILVDNDDPRIGLEIVKNGFYIPIIDRKTEKVIFTPEDYDKLRSKMSGLSYYGETDYIFSDRLLTPGVMDLANKIMNSEQDVLNKRTAINNVIKEAISSIGLDLKTSIDGDLTSGSVELIDTGSTGRGTNMPGDGDFDFMMRIDKSLLSNSIELNKLKQALLKSFQQENSTGVIGTGDFRLKGVSIDGLDNLVDIDITFVQKTDKVNYSTERALQDRLETIRKQDSEKYKLVVANILLAKQTLKDAGVYKPNRGDNPQGGLGGVGVENWILQNGGSFEDAARSFLVSSNGKSFEEFKKDYFIWDFGENHLAGRNSRYPHDNFVADNMNNDGYVKMQQVLQDYLKKVEFTKLSDNADAVIEAMANGIIDINGQPILENQSDSYNRKMGFTAIQWLGLVSSLFSIVIALLGILFLLFTR